MFPSMRHRFVAIRTRGGNPSETLQRRMVQYLGLRPNTMCKCAIPCPGYIFVRKLDYITRYILLYRL